MKLKGLNGGLDALIDTGKRLWFLWIGMAVAIGWIGMVSTSVRKQPTLDKKLDMVIDVQARDGQFMRDSLINLTDMKALMNQSLASHRSFDNRLRVLEHRPIQEGLGRWEYFPQAGPIPEKFQYMFEPASQWLGKKANGQ